MEGVERATVVIIGGGIVGCAAAYHLTRLGVRDVLLLEQGPLFATGGSTSHAPGIIFQTNPSRTMTRFARETVELYDSLELDGKPCWYGVGSLEVATTPERWADLHRKLGWAKSWGLPASLVSPDEAARRLPLLDPAKILGAYAVPTDGVAKAVWASEALACQARAAGARFVERTPVVGFEIERGRVRGVRTRDGVVACERVLLCAGIWGPSVGRLAGVSVPLTPVEHQLAWTTPVPELAGETREIVQPVLRHQDRDLYFRQRGDHYAVGSYAHEPTLVDAAAIRRHGEPDDAPASRPFTHDTFRSSWEAAVDLLPALGHVGIADAYNGMFSFTPDGFPLLGESALLDGFWMAEAVWITHAGGVAQAVAEWMTTGRPGVDCHECDVNRFDAHARTSSYVRARGAQQFREVYDVIHPLQPMVEPRPLRTSPFYDRHCELGGVFHEGRGWEQARWFEGNRGLLEEFPVSPRDGWSGRHWSPIAGAEHAATRERGALFDMTALPTIEVTGQGAAAFLDSVVSRRVSRGVGAVTYGLLLDEAGGVRSDVTVARLGETTFRVGCNGPLDLVWLAKYLPADGPVSLRDVTDDLCCLGLWGPRVREVVAAVSDDDWGDEAFPYYTARERTIGEVPVTALRLSYVGELGWELYAPMSYGRRLWRLLWEAGQSVGLVAAGRAAFDTLRLEKGYRLWGVDVDETRTPEEAGLGFAVKFGGRDFVGRDALLAGPASSGCRLRCLRLDDPAIVVMGREPIVVDGEAVGDVTSAGFGFSVGQSLAFGWLPASKGTEGERVAVEYFGRALPATVVADPVFDPSGQRLRG